MSESSHLSFTSKLPHVGTSIFSVMSALAKEHQAINLSQGFPNFDCSEKLIGLVTKYMQQGYNQYAPMPGVPDLRAALARKIEGLYGASIDPAAEITITAGATQALFTAIDAFVQPGDEVILIEPAYDSYRPAIELNGGIPIAYQLHKPDYAIHWEALGRLITERTRMILINSPHNPTGRILREADMRALEKLVEDTRILVLSDEVYEHLVYDGQLHQSVLRYPKLFERSLAVYSFGKTFHTTGWKMGYCVAPEPLMHEFRKIHQYLVFSVNTPIQYALAEYLEDTAVYKDLGPFYQDKRDRFLHLLENTGLKPLPCEGTYFCLADFSDLNDRGDVDFAQWLTKEKGVAVIPISGFYSSGLDEQVVRFCFAKTNETLDRAGRLLERLNPLLL